MESKLTLKLDQAIIEKAKKYATKRHKSLSKLVEDYFKGLVTPESYNEIEINPIIRELSGIISEDELLKWKDDYTNYLEQKYV